MTKNGKLSLLITELKNEIKETERRLTYGDAASYLADKKEALIWELERLEKEYWEIKNERYRSDNP